MFFSLWIKLLYLVLFPSFPLDKNHEFPLIISRQVDGGVFERPRLHQPKNINPVYVAETTDPRTGKLNLKVRGCFLCFSLRHNKKTHQKELGPSLHIVIEIYVWYACGRLGYHTDNCISPGCSLGLFILVVYLSRVP